MRTTSVGGCKYYTVYVDAATGYKIARFVTSTDAETQLQNFMKIWKWSETQTGNKMKIFRSDGGSEYTSNHFRDQLDELGIQHETSAAEQQWQNGIAERAHRTIMEMAMAMLAHSGLAKRWWAEAHGNCHAVRSIHWPSAHCLANFKVFGCTAFRLVNNPSRRNKLDPKATKCDFLGYAEHQKAYKLYDLEEHKTCTAVHVKFLENDFIGRRSKLDEYLVSHDDDDEEDDELTGNQTSPTRSLSRTASERFTLGTEQQRAPAGSLETKSHFKVPRDPTSQPRSNIYSASQRDHSYTRPDNASPTAHTTDMRMATDDFNSPPPGMTLRPRNSIRPPRRNFDYQQLACAVDLEDHIQSSITIDGLEFAYSATMYNDDVPQSHSEAMRSADREKWIEAEKLEMKQLLDAKTWKLVELPKDRKSIGTRWTYARKVNANGEVVRYKARLVCKGYSQIHGVDYTDTYSPVVKMTTVRVCLAIAASKGLTILQADADTAFVQATIENGVDLYVDQPPGYGDGTPRKMLLIKALYGLKQAALAWYEHCRTILQDIGFHQSQFDPCLYLRNKTSELEMICTYVDDFLIIAQSRTKADQILDEIEPRMKIKRQGQASYFLGIMFSYDDDNSSITLNQGAYSERILKRFGMSCCHAYHTPEVHDRDDLWNDETQQPTDQELYRSIVGSLMYLMVCTRPDIAHAVLRLSLYVHSLREPHMIGAKRLLRYIKSTPDVGLTFCRNKITLMGYSDASWASRPDRKSVTGNLCLLAGSVVFWKSARQRIVALSTCEAEYIALAEVAKEIMWLR
ncbi:hypothetical protein AeMF1_015438, partial [Aphanomyces euteiches]